MRSLFHFPSLHNHPRSNRLLQQPSHCARNVPSPASCAHAPPAPLPSAAFRCLPAPRSRAYRTLAHCHPLPGRPPCRALIPASRRRPHPLGSPRPHRDHRVPSRSSPPHHDHRAPPPSYTCCASPSASRPPCADIRVTPSSLSSRCGGPRALTGKNRTVCIPFSPNARKRPPSWQHPPEMHAFRDQDGNILAPCIHFRVQSGDSGCMARESCRQGPFFASRSPKSRMARRCCQRRPAFPRQRHAVRPNGLCAMRQRHAVRPNGLCALLSRFAVRDPPRGPRTDASRHLRAAPIPPAARTHRVQETSGTAQTTQCGHKNRIPKWRPY